MYEDVADEDLALYDDVIEENPGRWPHYAELDEKLWNEAWDEDLYPYTDYEDDDGWL